MLAHRGGKGYEVEFVALDGETVAVASVLASQVRAVVRREIAHARPVTEAPHNLRIDRGRAPMNTGAISE